MIGGLIFASFDELAVLKTWKQVRSNCNHNCTDFTSLQNSLDQHH